MIEKNPSQAVPHVRSSGRHHWIVQRVSAIVLVPLTVWFVFTVVALSGSTFDQAAAHFDSSWRVTLMILFVASIFYHGALGMEVVIEDYVSDLRLRTILILAVKILAVLFSLVGIVSTLRIGV